MLEIGKESIFGTAIDDLLDEKAEELIAEATTGSVAPQLNL